MSEAEKLRRLNYKQNRKKWLWMQALILAILVLATILSSVAYFTLNKATYISYAEKSDIKYGVYLFQNDFYDTTYSDDSDKAYVAALVDKIFADFRYELVMDAKNVDFEYAYRIDAILKVKDSTSGSVLLDKTDMLVPETTVSDTGNRFTIAETVSVDFNKYNDIAAQFTDRYKLNTKSELIIKLNVNVIGECEDFSENSTNNYSTALCVPLNQKTVNISTSSDIEEGVNQILACENQTLKTVFMILMFVFLGLSVISAIVMTVFAYLTRNTDINYEIQVNRIIKSYKSFIQKITNPFDTDGYQLLNVETFTEMLEIRDTIQSPVLMNENEDKTRTLFLIPTDTKLLYVYEIKVDDYDEIYAEESVEEVIILDNKVETSTIEEAIHTPDISLANIDYVEEETEPEDENGVEVIEVVWPEKEKNNKLYRYDPNGEILNEGDVVLVPSRDVAQNKDIIRKAAVAHANHKVAPDHIKHPLKKIIAIIKRKAEHALTPKDDE